MTKQRLHQPETTDHETALHDALRESLSPEGIVTIIAYLQPAGTLSPLNEEQRKALNEVTWFRESLLKMIGVEQFNEMINDLGL